MLFVYCAAGVVRLCRACALAACRVEVESVWFSSYGMFVMCRMTCGCSMLCMPWLIMTTRNKCGKKCEELGMWSLLFTSRVAMWLWLLSRSVCTRKLPAFSLLLLDCWFTKPLRQTGYFVSPAVGLFGPLPCIVRSCSYLSPSSKWVARAEDGADGCLPASFELHSRDKWRLDCFLHSYKKKGRCAGEHEGCVKPLL